MQFEQMKRREFITLLGGAAAAWPLAARAQQPERMRRIGVLCRICGGRFGRTGPPRGVYAGARSNWAGPSAATCGSITAGPRSTTHSQNAAELVALAPDVILALGGATVAPLLQATRTVPIVFGLSSIRSAPASSTSLARPGGNATGFSFSNTA